VTGTPAIIDPAPAAEQAIAATVVRHTEGVGEADDPAGNS
jgi:hypothetical protein